MTVDPYEWNERAIRGWEKAGFVEVSRSHPPRRGSLGGVGADAVFRLDFADDVAPADDDADAVPRAVVRRRTARGLDGDLSRSFLSRLEVVSLSSVMKVVLPDNSELELPDGASALDAARAIGPKLAEQAVLAKVNGEPRDLRLPLADGDRIQLLTTRDANDPDALYVLRHSSAHLLAEAVRRLYPGVKVAIGPPIENGFYYDFEFPEPIAEADLERIEAEVQREIAEGREWSREEISRGDAVTSASRRKDEPYKVELVDTAEGDISLYTQGDFTDLCRGPHLQNAKPIKAFKLTGLAGAYWRGDEKNKQLTRIYGTAFYSQADLDALPRAARGGAQARPPAARHAARPVPPRGGLARLAVLAPEGDGDLERARGPAPAREHATRLRRGEDPAHLRQDALGDLGPLGEVPRAHVPDPGRRADLRPQADELPRATCCSSATGLRSYRELPLRLAEAGTLHRNELAGTLHGLTRVRHVTQDDAHLFCTRDQIEDEIFGCLDFTAYLYDLFGLEYRFELSTRPENKLGTDEEWDFTEGALAGRARAARARVRARTRATARSTGRRSTCT